MCMLFASSLHFDFFTGLRQPPTWFLTPAAAAPLLLIVAGAPVALVAASGIARALHHFLLHTERVRRFPAWIELFFNTPSHHRVHHSSEANHLDKNFGAVLIVWDRLFGTFAPEPAEGVSRYGVIVAASTGSALSIVVHPWRCLAQRYWRARTHGDRFAALFAPPGALRPVGLDPRERLISSGRLSDKAQQPAWHPASSSRSD